VVSMGDVGDLLLRAVVEGPAGERFTRLRARELHSDEAEEVHRFLKIFFYGGFVCPWCGELLCPDSV
jgi:hypothetical protein